MLYIIIGTAILKIFDPIVLEGIQKAIFTLHCMCARETMRQYVGVASLVEILYLRLSSLSLPHTDTQYAVVVEGCQNEKKYKYLFKK